MKKELKLYLWDFSQIVEKGVRFENMVVCQLLKFCHFREDTEGYKMEPRYIRDTYKREVDFIVLQDKIPHKKFQSFFLKNILNIYFQTIQYSFTPEFSYKSFL